MAFDGSAVGEGTDTITTAYDGLGRPSTLSRNGTQQTGWTYEPDGTVKTRTDNLVSSTASAFTYDSLGRQTSAYSPLFGSTSNTVTFTWRLDSLLDTRAPFGGPTATTYAYDGAKRPVSECEGTCSGSQVDLERTYDRDGNIASEVQNLTGANSDEQGTQTFTYDPLERVTGSTLGSLTKSYAYDADSNRTTSTDGGVTSTFTYDTTDEIIKDHYSSTDHSFAYDGTGDLKTESVSNGGTAAATTYTYDTGLRMLTATQADGTTVNFTFDALGRHATRATGTGTLTTIDTYGYVGTTDSVVQDVENQAGITVNAALDALGDRLASGTSGGYAWLIPDLHGNVVGQLNSSGSTVTDAFRYDAYGLTEGTVLSGSIPSPWRFQGKLLESTSGGRDLYDFVARSYSPDIGAFTQLDAVAGSATNPVTLDRYLYAAGNPETLIDPDGHDTCHYGREDCDAIAAANRQAAQQAAAAQRQEQHRLWSRYGERPGDDEQTATVQAAPVATHDQAEDTLTAAQVQAIDAPILAQLPPSASAARVCGRFGCLPAGGQSGGGGMDPITAAHLFLGGVGMIPIIGSFANAADAAVYAAQGDPVGAALSLAAIIPVAGDAADAAKLGRLGLEAVDETVQVARDATDVAKAVEATDEAAQAAEDATKAVDTAGGEAGGLAPSVGALDAPIGSTQAGETFVRVGAKPENLNFTFETPGGTRPGTYAFPKSTFDAIGPDPTALKNFGDLPGEPPTVYRELEPPEGTPIQRGIVPGGQFGGEGGVPEVYFPEGF